MLVLSFKNGNDDPTRNSFDDKPIYDQSVKTNKKCMKNLLKGKETMIVQQEILLDYFYHQKYYKVIGIDLSRQVNTSIPQKINFVGKLEEEDGATMIFIAEKQQKTILDNGISKNIKYIERRK